VRGVLAAVGVLLLVAPMAFANLKFVDPTAHTLSTKELWQLAFKSSDVVMLGRVLAPISPPDTSLALGGAGAFSYSTVHVQLEPVDYLKGALDGDLIEVAYSYGELGLNSPWPVQHIAGVDSIGAILFLKRAGTGWELAKIWTHIPTNGKRSSDPALERELQDGLVALPQRKWFETTEQVRAWISEMPPDSSRAEP